ncbi:MAG: hypothetical protein EP319_06840 [Deltaproteobacteria bacterium]|nr:MAG: hypothetical protein EP319_06840 [Deltaproteobacteria bacterium]
MTRKIKITFTNREDQDDHFEDSWSLRDTPSAKAFQIELLNNLNNDFEFFTKFVGYRGGYRNPEFLGQLMNKCIDRINKDGRYYIRERAKAKIDQNFLNVMHHHFEVLRGSVWQESEYYIHSHPEVSTAVCGINHLVHEMEAWLRAESDASGVLTEFVGSNRTPLPKESVHDFDMSTDFGDIVLHYCQIGKTWWEVYTDNDAEIFEEAIQPLELVSGDFDIFWFANKKHPHRWEGFSDFLKKWGKDINDPELRIGYNCVAKWDNLHNLDPSKIKQEMIKRMYISKIEILEGEEILASRSLPISREFYEDL